VNRFGGYIPPSAINDRNAKAVFRANEVFLGEDGRFYRRFDVYTFIRHIHDILCDGDERLFEFVMRWFATLVQKPGEKMKSCLVFVGEEGCGKNVVIDTLGAILGSRHYISAASHMDLERFNSLLCGKTLLLLNECSRFSSAEEGVLRALVTEGMFRMEQKFKEPVYIDNLVNVICITNLTTHNLFSSVSANARRWCMARCGTSPTVVEDPLYWKGLWKWLGVRDGQAGTFGITDGVLAFADFLYNYRIPEEWYSGMPPATEELNLHKLGGMNEVAHWWHECLVSGRLYPPGADGELATDVPGKPQCKVDFHSAWIEGPIAVNLELLYQESFIKSFHGKRASVVSSSTLPWFKKHLQELGAFYTCRPGTRGVRKRQTVIYKLSVCRQHFCEKHRIDNIDSVFGDGIDAGSDSRGEDIANDQPDRDLRCDHAGDEWIRVLPVGDSHSVTAIASTSDPISPATPLLPAPPAPQQPPDVDEDESVLRPLWEEANEIERQLRDGAEQRRLRDTASSSVSDDVQPRSKKRHRPPPEVRRFFDDIADETSAEDESD